MSGQQSQGCGIVRGPASEGLPFSRYVKADDTIYVSGIVGRDRVSGNLEKDDFAAQTKCALAAIEKVLQDAGANLSDVVKATIYVTDMSRFAEVNEPYRFAFGDILPARTCVEVSSLPDPDAQVEIDVVAYRRDGTCGGRTD